MSSLQRALIVLAVLAAVCLVFVSPPLRILNAQGIFEARAYCTARANVQEVFSPRRFDPVRYQDCISEAKLDYTLLAVQLGTILAVSGVLVWTFKPRKNLLSVRG